MSREQTTSYQESYIRLVKEITQLQWVRESLPSHSKYYEGLKKKLEKQIHLKAFSERDLKNYQKEKDHHSLNSNSLQLRNMFNNNSNNSSKSYSNVIESVRFYENAIQQLETQIDQAKIMMDELNIEKRKLDDLCNELHVLYEQVIIPDPEDSSYIFEQHLKSDVEQLSIDIPTIKSKIEKYKLAQSKLYEARELIETAMKSLPGASTFMDRQAIAASSISNNNTIFGKTVAISSSVMDPIKKADKIAQQSYSLVLEASKICPEDVPNIPNQQHKSTESNVILYLTGYRGYRLKIESILRTQVNPRLNGLENQLNMAKYHFEQRTIEWIDHQIITLEAHLRTNGCLLNENLDREISMLRMGSRAAIAAVAEETSGRVTVDDALEITTDDGGPLPEYHSDDSTASNSSSSSDTIDETNIELNQPIQCDTTDNNLPSYAINNNNQQAPPPAYTR